MKVLAIILLSAILTSCGQIGAFLRPTGDFLKLESDSRILYETGALDIASQVAKHLDRSVKKVEKEQYGSFGKQGKLQ